MNLILHAIKSLFRKLENRIPKNLKDFLRIIGNDKIPGQVVKDMYYSIPSVFDDTIPEQTFETRELTSVEDDFCRRDDIQTYGYEVPDFVASEHGITENIFGKMFTVIWDGVEYPCEAKEALEMVVFGNDSIVRKTDDNNGKPFCILADPGWWGYDKLFIRTNEPGVHTVAFGKTIKPGEVNRLPKRYLTEHDHGVTPIEMGGTGASSVEEAHQSLGLGAYTITKTQSISGNPYETAVVDRDFCNVDNSIVILVWDGATTMSRNIDFVKFDNVTIPIADCIRFYFLNVIAGERIWVMCYHNGALYPLTIGYKVNQ